MIEFHDVSFTYPGAEEPALMGVSLRLAPGETVVLAGANGSGKSTLAMLCNGLLIPTAGSVTVDGIDTADSGSAFEVRSAVGLVLQNPDNQIVGTVVEEDVAFGPENLGVDPGELRTRVDGALSAVGLSGLARREPHLLSEGQKQRLAIAGALAMGCRHIVFDEPTAMLDPCGRSDVLALMDDLRERGHAVLHITHHLDDVARADRVVALSEGQVSFVGTPGELMSDASLLATLGLELPPLAAVAAELRTRGYHVPTAPRDASALVEALWP